MILNIDRYETEPAFMRYGDYLFYDPIHDSLFTIKKSMCASGDDLFPCHIMTGIQKSSNRIRTLVCLFDNFEDLIYLGRF